MNLRLPLALLLSVSAFAAAPAPAKLQPSLKRAYQKAVRAYLRAHQDRDGVFRLHDDRLDREWLLKLIYQRRDVERSAAGVYFGCADFQDAVDAHKVDVDFYARQTKSGWVVDRVAIHKVDGKARFLYDELGEPVSVR